MSSPAKSSKGFSSFSSSTRKAKARTARKAEARRRGSALASKLSRRRRVLMRRSSSSSEVSEKLESLRSLIPAGRNEGGEEEVAAPATDRLFQETADYILRLRAQVVVLQRLIQLYGTDDAVSSAVL